MGKATTKLKWEAVDKSNWHAAVEGESLPARIRMLDAKTYAVYRNGKYLGGETTLAAAQERAVTNAISEKNRVMKLWEEAHPNELPPGLQLTEWERAEFWRRNPPASRPAAGGRRTEPKQVDHNRDRGVVHTSPHPMEKESFAKEPRVKDATANKRSNKSEIILALLKSKGGCTREEVLRATRWTAVSMQQQAKTLGVGLRVDKGSKPFRYFAEEK